MPITSVCQSGLIRFAIISMGNTVESKGAIAVDL